MKKIGFSFIAAIFAITAAFAGSISQVGYYIWSEEDQAFIKLKQAPTQEWIDNVCRSGDLLDCFYTLDETGVVKTVLYFKGM